MQLNKVNGTAPTKPFPLTNSSSNPVINPGFSATFSRLLFEVVPFSTATGNVNHISPALAAIFGPKGFTCTNAAAKKRTWSTTASGSCPRLPATRQGTAAAPTDR